MSETVTVEVQRAVVGAILYAPDGRILLQQRDDNPAIPYPGWWTLFGGAVEAGESPDDAIARELMEELRIAPVMTFWYDYVCPVRTQPGVVTTRNYVYSGPLREAPESLTLYEGQAMRLFTREEALALELAYAQNEVVARWFAAQDAATALGESR